MPTFALSSNPADAVQYTFDVPVSDMALPEFELDRIKSRVKPVVPLKVPLPTSQLLPETIRYPTVCDAAPNADANVRYPATAPASVIAPVPVVDVVSCTLSAMYGIDLRHRRVGKARDGNRLAGRDHHAVQLDVSAAARRRD